MMWSQKQIDKVMEAYQETLERERPLREWESQKRELEMEAYKLLATPNKSMSLQELFEFKHEMQGLMDKIHEHESKLEEILQAAFEEEK